MERNKPDKVPAALVTPLWHQCAHACLLSHFSHVQLLATPWTVAHQAPLSMGFSRQEYLSGLPCLPPGELPNPGIETASPATSVLQVNSLLLSQIRLNSNFFFFFFVVTGSNQQNYILGIIKAPRSGKTEIKATLEHLRTRISSSQTILIVFSAVSSADLLCLLQRFRTTSYEAGKYTSSMGNTASQIPFQREWPLFSYMQFEASWEITQLEWCIHC